MQYSLNNHSKKFDVDNGDLCCFFICGFSGLSCAIKHWEISYECEPEHVIGHRAIAIVEALPVIGGLVGIADTIMSCFCDCFPCCEQSIEETLEKFESPDDENQVARDMLKMVKNSEKATLEHLQRDPNGPYLKIQKGSLSITPNQDKLPLSSKNLKIVSCEKQGLRKTFEDATLICEFDRGMILGVFDGHGGKQVAEFAKKEFIERFPKRLKYSKKGVRHSFLEVFDAIQNQITKISSLDSVGSTAVVSFIEFKTHLIYTATIGDSEATIYRLINEEKVSIPLSPIRDFGCLKEIERVSKAMNKPEIIEQWPKAKNFKTLRFPEKGLNLSRSLGDNKYKKTYSSPGIIHKAKITVQRLMSGDTLLLACDGLKDYVSETLILQKIEETKQGEDLAKALVDYALCEKKSRDNVSVIAVAIV